MSGRERRGPASPEQASRAAGEVSGPIPGRRTLVERASQRQRRGGAVEVGKRTLTQGLRSDQEIAKAGTRGAGVPFPHKAAIEASFGRPIGATAHVDAAAMEASAALGAEGFAYGDHVGFAAEPSLFVAAHEAAHTLQSSDQVQLFSGGGDAHEAHANEAASLVVQGVSAASLFSGGGGGASPTVRRFDGKHPAPPARVPDSRPFHDVGKTSWSLGDDGVFVCVAGPDGRPVTTRVTASAATNPERWNSLGKRWVAAAPGRTWPRPAPIVATGDQAISTAPKSAIERALAPVAPPWAAPHDAEMCVDPSAVARTDSSAPATRPPATKGIEIDLRAALDQLRKLGIQLDLPLDGANVAYFDLHPIEVRAKITAPHVRLAGFSAGAFHASKGALSGLVIDVDTKEKQANLLATFASATLDQPLVMVGEERILIEKVTLIGGMIGGSYSGIHDGTFGGGVQFKEARLSRITYPGAPPVDLVITNSTLFGFAESVKAALAKKGHQAGESPVALPAVPKLPLAGTRVSMQLDGVGGSHTDGASGKTMGGFRRFEAQLVKDGTGPKAAFPEVLATIVVEGATVYRSGPRLEGGVKRVHVAGSANFVLALLDSPAVRAQPAVVDVLGELSKVGIVPAVGTQITLENLQFGAGKSTASVRGDLVLELEAPGLAKLHVELREVALDADPVANTGRVEFGHLLLVMSDPRGRVASLTAQGSVDKGERQLGGAIRHLQGSGDVSRILRTARQLALPPKLAAVLAAVRDNVSADGSLDLDLARKPGKDGTDEVSGNAHARLDVEGVGSIDLSVTNFHGTGDKKHGTIGFDRFEAHLAPQPGKGRGDVVALVVTGASGSGGTDAPRSLASASMIDVRGDATRAAAMVSAIHRKIASLPPAIQQAATLVRTLDLGAAGDLTTRSTPATTAPASKALPELGVATDAHVALAIAGVGRIEATLHGFSGETRHGGVLADFDSFEVSLITPSGRRAARIRVRGGHGHAEPGEPGKRTSPTDIGVQLDEAVIEGNSWGLLEVLEKHRAALASAPGPVRTGFEFLSVHQTTFRTAVGARATDLAVESSDGRTALAIRTMTAAVVIPAGAAVVSITGAEANPDQAGFDTLEIRLEDDAASLRISDGQWVAAGPTTAGSISVHGEGAKLLPILEPRILSMLAPELGTAIRKFSQVIVNATATNVAVTSTGDDVTVKLPYVDLQGAISWVDNGVIYDCEHASIKVFGARGNFGAGEFGPIDAEHLHITGRFVQTSGGKQAKGMLDVRTGAARLARGGKGLEAQDIHASGRLDLAKPAPASPASDTKIRDFDDNADAADKYVPVLRQLEFESHTPLHAGTYGSVRIGAGAMLHLHGSIVDQRIALIEATITGELSAAFTQAHGLAVVNQRLEVDASGLFGPLLKIVGPVTRAATWFYDVPFDLPGLVAFVVPKLRPYVVSAARSPDDTWAEEPYKNEQTKQQELADSERAAAADTADLLARKSAWQAKADREAADEPKMIADLKPTIADLMATDARVSVTLARPEPAAGISPLDQVSGFVHLTGVFEGGKLRLHADAEIERDSNSERTPGKGKLEGLDTGEISLSSDPAGGRHVQFEGFHVERFRWDEPTPKNRDKPPAK